MFGVVFDVFRDPVRISLAFEVTTFDGTEKVHLWGFDLGIFVCLGEQKIHLNRRPSFSMGLKFSVG